MQARELARSVNFAPSVVSGGIDLLLMCARRHDPGSAEALLRETEAQSMSTAGWHEWLWRLRLCRARAELAFARRELDNAVSEASEGIRQSRARPAQVSGPGIGDASARAARSRPAHDAIVDAGIAVSLARAPRIRPCCSSRSRPCWPWMGLTRGLPKRTRSRPTDWRGSPDDAMRRIFSESEVVQRIERLSSSNSASKAGS